MSATYILHEDDKFHMNLENRIGKNRVKWSVTVTAHWNAVWQVGRPWWSYELCKTLL